MRKSMLLFGCLALSMLRLPGGWAEEPLHCRLHLVTEGLDSGWPCDTVLRACFAGGREGLRIRIMGLEEPYYPALEEGWPQSVTIEAGLMEGETFTPDSRLFHLLDIAPRVYELERYDDSVAHAEGTLNPRQRSLGVCYRFGMTIPEEYVGRRIFLRVTFNCKECGPLTDTYSIDPILPCNDYARQIVQTTYVEEATRRGNHERAVQLADSLIALGWREQRGLGWAMKSAAVAHRPTEELRFMDLDFEAHETIEAFGHRPKDEVSRRRAEEFYQDCRQKVLAKIAQQQQK